MNNNLAGLSYETVVSSAQAQWRLNNTTDPGAHFEQMLHDFLNGDRMRETSDAALAQLAAQFFHSRHGHAINLVSIIAAEQQRRVVIGMAMSQRTANKALCWSMWGTFAAIIAAFASVVALIK